MAELIVKGQSFNYPDPGREPGWGEDATEWARAITEAVAEVVAGGDILKAQAQLINDTAVPTNITGLVFSSLQTRLADINYVIQRGTLQENGKITVSFDGTDWTNVSDYFGQAVGVKFSVLPTGQLQYTLTDSPEGNATMFFRAITLGV